MHQLVLPEEVYFDGSALLIVPESRRTLLYGRTENLSLFYLILQEIQYLFPIIFGEILQLLLQFFILDPIPDCHIIVTLGLEGSWHRVVVALALMRAMEVTFYDRHRNRLQPTQLRTPDSLLRNIINAVLGYGPRCTNYQVCQIFIINSCRVLLPIHIDLRPLHPQPEPHFPAPRRSLLHDISLIAVSPVLLLAIHRCSQVFW